MDFHKDTIFALSSGVAPSGVAIIRISGAHCLSTLNCLTRNNVPPPRMALLRNLWSAKMPNELWEDIPLDKGLVLWFPGPNSFTGEDMAELHIHGGVATIRAVLSVLSNLPFLRHAEKGEFTRRAFRNNRMDQLQVEGLSDLIQAQSDSQRKQALRQSDGGLSQICQNWMDRLIGILAKTEALIDFSDEDLPEAIEEAIRDEISALIFEMKAQLQASKKAEKLRSGLTIAIVGAPNVGKSSLLNWLAGHQAAIVTDIPGTTRDLIHLPLVIADVPVTFVDTAGIRDSEDLIEQEGIRLAHQQVDEADLILFIQDISNDNSELSDKLSLIMNGRNTIKIYNKIDLMPNNRGINRDNHYISLKSGAGLDHLMEALSEWITANSGYSESPLFTRIRHTEILISSVDSLNEAIDIAGLEISLTAESLRQAVSNLGRLTGKVDIEAILDHLFKEFCIGK